MLLRHIDALALLLIVLALTAFQSISAPRIVRAEAPSEIRIHNAISRIDTCPWKALIPRFR